MYDNFCMVALINTGEKETHCLVIKLIAVPRSQELGGITLEQ